MCELCRLPGNYLEQLYAEAEELGGLPADEPNWDLADPDYKALLRQPEDHIIRGEE